VRGKEEDGYRKVLWSVTVLLYIGLEIGDGRGREEGSPYSATQSVYCHTTETELTIFRAVCPLNFVERRENKESCLSENSFAFLSYPFLCLYFSLSLSILPPRRVVCILSYRYTIVEFYS
jgi:hypothetical protein